MKNSKGVFLDRDGTLIVNRHYLSDPAGVELLPGVRDTLHQLVADGFKLFLFTNQSGVGRGMFTMEAVTACNDRMIELLGVTFTDSCVAPEAPGQPIVYRKPSPRFIHEMIAKHGLDPAQTWMVGDSEADVQAGKAAGVRSALIGDSAKVEPGLRTGLLQCRDLADFYLRLTTNSTEQAGLG